MIDELNKICSVSENQDLTQYNTYRLNSKCRVFIKVNNVEELQSIINILEKYKSKWFVIGNGSNVIIPEFYDGVIIKLDGFNEYKINDNELYVESGYMINKLAIKLANEGYAGLDFACGIPGTIGGSIYGNAGCYGHSISEILKSVIVLDGKDIKELTNEECKFEYRDSIFKKSNNKMIILSAKFNISKTNKEELLNIIKERMNKRSSTQPIEYPSCGSVFRNPVDNIAGKLIDEAGLKGFSIGGASISEKHANFIINKGNATYEDIIKLIDKIKKEIKEKNNIDLILEQEIIK